MSGLDDDLRTAFTTARRGDATRTPPFARVLGRSRRLSGARRTVWFAAAMTMVVVIAVVWRRERPREIPAIVRMEPGDLRMPTDFLLDRAGAFQAAIPSIGRIEGWIPSIGVAKRS